jgi:DNA-binding transcriptional ArsR family regulator
LPPSPIRPGGRCFAQLEEHKALSVSELAQPFPMSLPAIMKHLDVLSGAGLITRTKKGRTVTCRLTAEPMEHAMDWLNHYQRFWTERLDRSRPSQEEDSCPPKQASQTEPSLTIKHRLGS